MRESHKELFATYFFLQQRIGIGLIADNFELYRGLGVSILFEFLQGVDSFSFIGK